ncbi:MULTISPECIES: MbnP family protein [unclassified Cellulophaga]|uniref:MbnP family protein n=1 Tax=unclassified Cellulophaga TaxID=2634405 RepID=UPI0026E2A892|nr:MULTISPECIES: MbnP family protein [unclassified Cellulophaga]MDO6491722.1 hypothetical protein [Cellulophaga sp. 2_MG-2023]MDO6495623.1 hypothetical protein [Cellulophaga sp. 3_MG-2023]
MKTNFLKSIVVSFSLIALASCSSDDDGEMDNVNPGQVTLEFDSGFAGNELTLGTANTANANGEALTVSRLNYIISNIVLIDEDGMEYSYPKENSYFIISEDSNDELADNTEIVLEGVPAGTYKAVKFGIGVDKEKYDQGLSGAGDFWDAASEYDMTWSWASGYKYINFEGAYTSGTTTDENFKVHLGRASDEVTNYAETTIEVPAGSAIIVNEDMAPEVHIITDANALLTAKEAVSLEAYGNAIMGGEGAVKVAANVPLVFKVDHVHNNEAGNSSH